MGFVNEVVPSAELGAATQRWVDEILKGSAVAVQTSKAVVNRGLAETGVETAMRAQPGYPEFRAWRASEDVSEGPRAFAEKRQPAWRTR